jgi:hypothetical protein
MTTILVLLGIDRDMSGGRDRAPVRPVSAPTNHDHPPGDIR